MTMERVGLGDLGSGPYTPATCARGPSHGYGPRALWVLWVAVPLKPKDKLEQRWISAAILYTVNGVRKGMYV